MATNTNKRRGSKLPTFVLLNPPEKEALQKLAQETERSVGYYIRQAVVKFLTDAGLLEKPKTPGHGKIAGAARVVLVLLSLALASSVSAQTPTKHPSKATAVPVVDHTPEFLRVKLGKTLAEQFPRCITYFSGSPEFDQWNYRDPAGFRCYTAFVSSSGEESLTGDIFDHNLTSYVGKEEMEKAPVQTKSDSDTKEVGYVSGTYDMDGFKQTFTALREKRGKPTCTFNPIQTLMGAVMKQLHCEWKEPWGVIAVTAPSSDDVTMFDVWALTNHHMKLRSQQEVADKKINQKDF